MTRGRFPRPRYAVVLLVLLSPVVLATINLDLRRTTVVKALGAVSKSDRDAERFGLPVQAEIAARAMEVSVGLLEQKSPGSDRWTALGPATALGEAGELLDSKRQMWRCKAVDPTFGEKFNACAAGTSNQLADVLDSLTKDDPPTPSEADQEEALYRSGELFIGTVPTSNNPETKYRIRLLKSSEPKKGPATFQALLMVKVPGSSLSILYGGVPGPLKKPVSRPPAILATNTFGSSSDVQYAVATNIDPNDNFDSYTTTITEAAANKSASGTKELEGGVPRAAQRSGTPKTRYQWNLSPKTPCKAGTPLTKLGLAAESIPIVAAWCTEIASSSGVLLLPASNAFTIALSAAMDSSYEHDGKWYLGAKLESQDSHAATEYGVTLVDVIKGWPAERNDLLAGDVITSCQGLKSPTAPDLRSCIEGGTDADGTIKLEFERSGTPMTKLITLTKKAPE